MARIHGQHHKKIIGGFCVLPGGVIHGSINRYGGRRLVNMQLVGTIFFLCRRRKIYKKEKTD